MARLQISHLGFIPDKDADPVSGSRKFDRVAGKMEKSLVPVMRKETGDEYPDVFAAVLDFKTPFFSPGSADLQPGWLEKDILARVQKYLPRVWNEDHTSYQGYDAAIIGAVTGGNTPDAVRGVQMYLVTPAEYAHWTRIVKGMTPKRTALNRGFQQWLKTIDNALQEYGFGYEEADPRGRGDGEKALTVWKPLYDRGASPADAIESVFGEEYTGMIRSANTPLRAQLIRLAHDKPELREHILPLVSSKQAAGHLRVEVIDTINDDKYVQQVRGGEDMFQKMLRKYKAPRYTVQLLEDDEIIADNQGGYEGGKIRRWDKKAAAAPGALLSDGIRDTLEAFARTMARAADKAVQKESSGWFFRVTTADAELRNGVVTLVLHFRLQNPGGFRHEYTQYVPEVATHVRKSLGIPSNAKPTVAAKRGADEFAISYDFPLPLITPVHNVTP